MRSAETGTSVSAGISDALREQVGLTLGGPRNLWLELKLNVLYNYVTDVRNIERRTWASAY